MLHLEIEGEKMQMQQRALGCGGSPAYGPIIRNAEIWQTKTREQVIEYGIKKSKKRIMVEIAQYGEIVLQNANFTMQ